MVGAPIGGLRAQGKGTKTGMPLIKPRAARGNPGTGMSGKTGDIDVFSDAKD